MPPDLATTVAGGLGKCLPAVPADLRDDNYDLIDLLDRSQRAMSPAVAGLAATLPSRDGRVLPRRGLG
jgi:hypothetical protein